jgi:hypothetical protein
MHRRIMFAVLAIAPAAFLLAQVRPDYPKTPGEVTVANKPKPIVAFFSAAPVSRLRKPIHVAVKRGAV